MRFQTPLIRATLLRRYKRFLADCRLPDGREITAHVANPGSMLGLADPGMTVWLEPNDDPKKKLRFAWRLVEDARGALVGVDTGAANRILRPALQAGTVPCLEGYDTVRPEVRYDEGSRIDFLLSADGRPDAYVEVKSVTLSRAPGLAEFPDCVTARGTRHLGALARMVGQGHRAVMLYLVQRDDAERMALAADLDPAYAAAFDAARAAGVEALALGCAPGPEGIALSSPLPLVS
ncbi:DNA/RNA nuclease SfsA [Citreimonas sp.]|uniref:DNA/RNA nuclease SfsA n=1 Tax=Citreimonas sp. TaxID=3036715 RepID=UPI004059E08B